MNRTTEVSMMTHDHLTDEQILEMLDAAAAGDARVHLAGCERCAAEFEAVQESLAGFRLAAHGLAEARFSPVLEVREGFLGGMRRGMMAWPLGLAAAGVLLAASMTMAHHAGPSAPVVTTASGTAAPLESDEALMESINQDLSTSVPPSLAPLSVASAGGTEMVSKHNSLHQ